MTQQSNNLNELQIKVLEIYKAIKKLCDDNHIRFFAIGGTAIGAARHKGFIPWDDDIDIAMPRKDYERFKELSNTLPNNLELVDYTTDESVPVMFGKVQDINTCYTPKTALNLPNSYSGVAVDIMPLDGVPANYLLYRWHRFKLSVLFSINSLLISYENNDIPHERLFKKISQSIAGTLFRGLDKSKIKRYFVALNKKYDFDTASYLARTWMFGTHDGMQAKARYHQVDFANYTEMPFEDTTIRMPVGYDRYLSALYPNYMTLPPKEKQMPRHNDGITDLCRSYKYYAAKKQGKIIGYTAGCYDMFHIGHLNILKQAKRHCDYLIVGVNSDDAMYSYKKKYPVISESERMAIIEAIKYVDEVVLVNDTDKMVAYEQHEYDTIFVGDDHKGEPKWIELEKKLAKHGSKVHYFGYTGHTSSTKLRSALDDMIEKKRSKK